MPYGVNDKRRVPCTNSPHHGFRPWDEVCKYCAPEEDYQPDNFDPSDVLKAMYMAGWIDQ